MLNSFAAPCPPLFPPSVLPGIYLKLMEKAIKVGDIAKSFADEKSRLERLMQ